MDIYGILQQQKNTLFSSLHGTFTRIDRILGIEYTLNLKEQIIKECSHTMIKLSQKSITKIHGDSPNTCKLNILLNTWFKEVSRYALRS